MSGSMRFLNITTGSSDCLARTLDIDCALKQNALHHLKLSDHHSTEPRLYEVVPDNLWYAEVIQGPLARHAGYYQDQFFAPRRLHFGPKQVYWECGKTKACEVYPHGLPVQLLQDSVNDNVAQTVLRLAYTPSEMTMISRKSNSQTRTKLSWIELWHQIISLYSQCSLPDPRTKLIGISSIAQEVQALSNDKYIAGTWQSNLINDLLWYVDGAPSHRPNVYCAPSWSWASVEGTIHYLPSPSLFRDFAKVVDVHVSAIDPNFPTGQVAGGFLILRSYLIKIPAPQFAYVRGPLTAGCFYPDDRHDAIDAHFYCLLLRLQRSALGDYLCGLVLRRIAEPWGVVYERAGMFRCLRGDSLHILGQKKYGADAYVFEDSEEVVDSTPFAADVMIV